MKESRLELKHPVTDEPLPRLRELTVRELEIGISFGPLGAPEVISSNHGGEIKDPRVQEAHNLWIYARGAGMGATAFVRGDYFKFYGVIGAPVQFYKER